MFLSIFTTDSQLECDTDSAGLLLQAEMTLCVWTESFSSAGNVASLCGISLALRELFRKCCEDGLVRDKICIILAIYDSEVRPRRTKGQRPRFVSLRPMTLLAAHSLPLYHCVLCTRTRRQRINYEWNPRGSIEVLPIVKQRVVHTPTHLQVHIVSLYA